MCGTHAGQTRGIVDSGNGLKNTRVTDLPTSLNTPPPLIRIAVCVFLALAGALTLLSATDQGNADPQRIVDRMVREQATRFERFEGYTRTQHYSVTTSRFNLKADLVARIHRDRVKGKSYEIISRTGSPVIQSHVFDALLEAEVDTSKQQGNGELLTPENYSFRLIGQEDYAGHHCYVLETDPKHKDKRLLKGKIWVNTEDYGVVHVEGKPSDSLSFFVGRPMIVQDFTKIQDYWWVSRRHSYIDNMFLGKSDLVIDYSDYQFELRHSEATAIAPVPTAGSR
jgi:Outer membrane lipoprotein-sorting protein